MEYQHAKRLDHFQTGIFAAMDEKKAALIKSGRTVYNLSVGSPDFAPPEHIMKAASEACLDPLEWKYSLVDSQDLLQAVVSFYKKRFGVDITPEEVTGVHGTQEGMGHLGLAMCNRGDICLLPDPGYPIYEAGTYLGEADVYYYPLVKDHDFLPDFTAIPEDVLKKTKFLVLSYPSNPVGAVAPKSMYEEAIRYAKKYGFFIINDNAYSDIVFDGREGYSFLSIPGAKEVGVEFYSLSKSYNFTGLRVSFLIGNKSIIGALKLLRSQYDFGISYPAQIAAIAALSGPQDAVREQCRQYQERRDALLGGLRELGWNVPDSAGTMFVWVPVPANFSSESFTEALMEYTGVIGTPGTAFGPKGAGYIRFALVRPADEFRRITKLIGEHLTFHGDEAEFH